MLYIYIKRSLVVAVFDVIIVDDPEVVVVSGAKS
jgi:hypothetical protein